MFPIKCVGGPSSLMRAWLQRYVNEHSAIYIVPLSAYEVEDVNGSNAFDMYTVSQEPQCARFSRVFTCPPIV